MNFDLNSLDLNSSVFALSVFLLFSLVGFASADNVSAAVDWLKAHQDENGSVGAFMEHATAAAAHAIWLRESDSSNVSSALAFLEAGLEDAGYWYWGAWGEADIPSAALYVFFASSHLNQIDLPNVSQRLLEFQQPSGGFKGYYDVNAGHSVESSVDTAWALRALVNPGAMPPANKTAAIQFLYSLQNADGSFNLTNATVNDSLYSLGPEPVSLTALVLLALRESGENNANTALALNFLKEKASTCFENHAFASALSVLAFKAFGENDFASAAANFLKTLQKQDGGFVDVIRWNASASNALDTGWAAIALQNDPASNSGVCVPVYSTPSPSPSPTPSSSPSPSPSPSLSPSPSPSPSATPYCTITASPLSITTSGYSNVAINYFNMQTPANAVINCGNEQSTQIQCGTAASGSCYVSCAFAQQTIYPYYFTASAFVNGFPCGSIIVTLVSSAATPTPSPNATPTPTLIPPATPLPSNEFFKQIDFNTRARALASSGSVEVSLEFFTRNAFSGEIEFVLPFSLAELTTGSVSVTPAPDSLQAFGGESVVARWRIALRENQFFVVKLLLSRGLPSSGLDAFSAPRLIPEPSALVEEAGASSPSAQTGLLAASTSSKDSYALLAAGLILITLAAIGFNAFLKWREKKRF